MEDFRLNEEELRKSAISVCKIRKKIMDKSEAIKAEDVEFLD